MEDIEVRVYRSRIKLPVIFFVPAAILLTMYVLVYMLVNSQAFIDRVQVALNDALPGKFAVEEIVFEPWFTDVHAWGVTIDGANGDRIIRATEVHATLDPLALLTRRILVTKATVRDGGFDMRVEGDGNIINLLDAFGLEGPEDPEDVPDAPSTLRSIGLHDLACIDCYYSFWIDLFEFRVPNVTIENGEVDIVDGVLFIRVPYATIPNVDFEFRHWLYYFPKEYGDWMPTVDELVVHNWAWAGDGFTVEQAYTKIHGIEGVATGSMTFPDRIPGHDREMYYTARGDFAIHPWNEAAQYFIRHLFHVDAASVQVDVDGSLQEIRGEATFDIGTLDAYGIQFHDLVGTAVLHDELVVIDAATGTLHSGSVAINNFYFDMFSGRFGGDATVANVDPMGLAGDLGYDYPWLRGRASGSAKVLGRVPYAEEYGVETSPFVTLSEYLTPTVEVEVTSDFVFERTGDLDTLPGRRFVLRPGTRLWSTEDHLGIDDARIHADNIALDVDDFVFDWLRYEVLRDQYGNIARIDARSSTLGGLLRDYESDPFLTGTLVASADLVGLFNYPTANFDVTVTNPALDLGAVQLLGDRLRANGRLHDGRVTFADARFDSAIGHVQLSGWLDLLRDPTGVVDELGEMVTDYLYPTRNAAHLDVVLDDFDLATARKIAGVDAEIAGVIDAQLSLRGTLQDPSAKFDARASNAVVLGQALRVAELEGTIADQSIDLSRFRVEAGAAAVVDGRGSLGFDERLAFDLRGDGIALGDLAAIPDEAGAGGQLDFRIRLNGTLDQPQFAGDLRIEDLVAVGRPLGDLALVANTIGDTTHLVGALLPWITVDFEIPHDGESSLYGRFGIDHLNLVEAVPELADVKVVEHAEATGMIEVFLDPTLDRYQVIANLSEVDVRAFNKTFRNQGPIIAGLNNGEVIQLQQATLGTDNRYVSMQGAVALDDELVDIEVRGDLDLSLLTGLRFAVPELFPEAFLESSGVLAIDASLKGTSGEFVAGGYVDFGRSEFLVRNLADPVTVSSGRVEFSRDQIAIPATTPLRGNVLGGAFGLTGSVDLAGTSIRNVVADLWSQNMSYRIANVANLSFDTQLRFEAEDLDRTDSWLLSGNVDVLDGLYYENISIFQEQLTNRLIGAFSRRTERYEASLLEAYPMLEEMNFDVTLRARDGFRIQNEIDRLALALEFRIDVRLQNTLADPRIQGDVDIIDGRVTFQGETFEVRTGTLSFFGDPDKPLVDIVAEADIFNTCRDTDIAADASQTMSLSGVVDTGDQKFYHITLNVKGQLDRLDIEFESYPYADQRDILSLLLTGCTVDQLTASSASSPTLEVALGPVLGWIEGQVQNVVEVEEFTITPSVDRLKATVGDSISRRLSWKLQLDTGLTEVATGQRFQLAYRLSDRWSAQVSESSTESSQFDSFLVDFKLKYRLLLD